MLSANSLGYSGWEIMPVAHISNDIERQIIM